MKNYMNILLKDAPNKIDTIKVLCEIKGYSLEYAKNICDNLPCILCLSIEENKAKKIGKKLDEVNAVYEIQNM